MRSLEQVCFKSGSWIYFVLCMKTYYMSLKAQFRTFALCSKTLRELLITKPSQSPSLLNIWRGKGMVLHMMANRCSLIFPDSCVFFTSVFITREIVAHHTQVALVLHLLQNCVSIHAVTKFAASPSNLMSVEEIPGNKALTWEELDRAMEKQLTKRTGRLGWL